MKLNFGIGLPTSRPAQETIELAKEVEKNGFNRIWIGDHYFYRNPFLLLTAIAIQTQHVQLCTGITNPFHLSPAVLASTALTMDELSDGRFLLGLGVGDEVTLKQLGAYPQDPIRAINQAVAAIRVLWSGKSFSGYVDRFHWQNVRLRIDSARNLPLYIGAQGKGMVDLAFEVGDGLIMNSSSPLDFKWLKDQGNPRTANFEKIAYIITELGDSPSSYLKQLLAQIIAGTPTSVLKRHDIPISEARMVTKLIRERDTESVDEVITQQMIDTFSIVGTISDVENRIEELLKEGVSGFIFGGPLAFDRKAGIEELNKIIQTFNST